MAPIHMHMHIHLHLRFQIVVIPTQATGPERINHPPHEVDDFDHHRIKMVSLIPNLFYLKWQRCNAIITLFFVSLYKRIVLFLQRVLLSIVFLRIIIWIFGRRRVGLIIRLFFFPRSLGTYVTYVNYFAVLLSCHRCRGDFILLLSWKCVFFESRSQNCSLLVLISLFLYLHTHICIYICIYICIQPSQCHPLGTHCRKSQEMSWFFSHHVYHTYHSLYSLRWITTCMGLVDRSYSTYDYYDCPWRIPLFEERIEWYSSFIVVNV